MVLNSLCVSTNICFGVQETIMGLGSFIVWAEVFIEDLWGTSQRLAPQKRLAVQMKILAQVADLRLHLRLQSVGAFNLIFKSFEVF